MAVGSRGHLIERAQGTQPGAWARLASAPSLSLRHALKSRLASV